jgi:hypothetical protein
MALDHRVADQAMEHSPMEKEQLHAYQEPGMVRIYRPSMVQMLLLFQ